MTNCIEVRGCIMGLIGENGARKTTPLKCLLGLLRRDEGEIALLGCDPWEQPRQAKAEVGVVLDDCFFPRQSPPT